MGGMNYCYEKKDKNETYYLYFKVFIIIVFVAASFKIIQET